MIRGRAALLLLAVLAVLTAGCSTTGGGNAPPRSPVTIRTVPAPLPVQPASIDIPKIGAHSTLLPIGLDPKTGELAQPDVTHPQQAVYYCVTDVVPAMACKSGVVPGQVGPSIIFGHVDGSIRNGAHQEGIFFHLHELKVGDKITVRRVDGTDLTYTTYKIIQKAKTDFPTQEVYGNTAASELRLMTCSGTFIGGQFGYADNTIVFARLA